MRRFTGRFGGTGARPGPGVSDERSGDRAGRRPGGWSVVTVRGPSMVPTLRDGDYLLIRRGGVRPGDVVVAEIPHRTGLMVKRAVERRDDGWWLLSDNTFVTSDSREFGAGPDRASRARAVLRIRDGEGGDSAGWRVWRVRVVRVRRLATPGGAP